MYMQISKYENDENMKIQIWKYKKDWNYQKMYIV